MRKQYSSTFFPYPGLTGIWIAWDANGNKQCFNTEAGAIEHAKPNAIHYGGFTIAPNFNISKNGKLVWDMVDTLEQAKSIIDQSNKLKAMPDKQKALTKLVSLGRCQTDAERLEEQINNHFENQLHNDERR